MKNNLKAAATALKNKKNKGKKRKKPSPLKKPLKCKTIGSIGPFYKLYSNGQQVNYPEVQANKNRIAKSLKEERLKQNLTQKELGEKAELSASTIGNAERNNGGTSINTLLYIANSLGKELIIK